MLQTVIAERGIAMFRLANYGDDEVNELYKYLSTTASKVIWNGLDQWAGSVEKILDLYMMEFAGPSVGIMDQDFFDGISQFLSADLVRSEIRAAADKVKMGRNEVSSDGLIGMEILMRKISRMKDKMADPVHYYTFDLFEEYLFARMLESYDPDAFEDSRDPYVITTEEEIAESIQKLVSEFKVGEDLEAEIGEPGIAREYAEFLAHTIHRLDKMDLWSSEETGYESLFFWDADYEMIFNDGFVDGIRRLTGGEAKLLGYGYKDVTGIFTDIGMKAPLLLVGTETAFETVGAAVREKLKEMSSPFDNMGRGMEGFQDIPDNTDDLPFS